MVKRKISKFKLINLAIKDIKKKFGKGAILSLNENERAMEVSVIRTGSIGLDNITGIGGIPRGRITEIFGPESGGKTTLVLHIISEAQKKGGIAAFIDTEHALDPKYAKKIGINLDGKKFLISQPESGEEALDIAERLISSEIDIIVIDSVAGLVSQKEIDGEMGKEFMGLQSKLMSKAMRKLTHIVKQSNSCLIFTNQIREKFGVRFGEKTVTPGGRALKFFASLRIFITRIGTKRIGKISVANETKVIIKKNKCAAPFREAEFLIKYGIGIDKLDDVVRVLVSKNEVKKEGYSFRFGDFKFKTISKLRKKLKEDKKMKKLMFKKARDEV